jgi:hypothetical protein
LQLRGEKKGRESNTCEKERVLRGERRKNIQIHIRYLRRSYFSLHFYIFSTLVVPRSRRRKGKERRFDEMGLFRIPTLPTMIPSPQPSSEERG